MSNNHFKNFSGFELNSITYYLNKTIELGFNKDGRSCSIWLRCRFICKNSDITYLKDTQSINSLTAIFPLIGKCVIFANMGANNIFSLNFESDFELNIIPNGDGFESYGVNLDSEMHVITNSKIPYYDLLF